MTIPLYQNYVIIYAKAMTWINYGRKYDTPIDPLRLIYIDPIDVVGIQQNEDRFDYSDPVSEVQPGDWDQQYIPIEEHWMYQSFRDRFVHDCSWKETTIYRRTIDKINEGETWWGCSSETEFKQRLQNMERLYRRISTEGYKTQKELLKEEQTDPIRRGIHDYWPPELNEITVNIGHDGRLILQEGRHRFIISRLLNLEKIPVRVKVRHKEWQELRDISEDSISKHPDMQ